LAVVAEESAKRHAQLVAKRKAGDLMFEPDESALHVWELKTTRNIVSMGHTSRHEYVHLFTTRAAAIEGASEEVRASVEAGGMGCFDDKLKAMLEKSQHVKVVAYVSSHYSGWSFEISMEPVWATGRRPVFSDPPEPVASREREEA
jgi:hypothetical protein